MSQAVREQDSRPLCVLRAYLLMLLAPRAGDDCTAVLDAPPQQQLSRRPAQLLGNAVDLLILQAWQLSDISSQALHGGWLAMPQVSTAILATSKLTGSRRHAERDRQASPDADFRG